MDFLIKFWGKFVPCSNLFLSSSSSSSPESHREPAAEVVGKVEDILKYRFRNPGLVEEALTHPSYYHLEDKHGVTYERLEFIGDAVLNLVVAWEVFRTYETFTPGELTRLRAANVDTESLARLAVRHGLHRFIRHKGPKIDAQIEAFKEQMDEYPIHSNGLLDTPKVLADVMEALLGAIFVDSTNPVDTIREVYNRLAYPLISPETLGKHPVTELNELCQKNRMHLKFETGSWSENQQVEAVVDDNIVRSSAKGPRKEIAQNRAAKAALEVLKQALANRTQIIALSD